MSRKEKSKKVRLGKMAALGMAALIFVLFFVGMHNADNCANWMNLNLELKQYNISYSENGLFLKGISATGCYQYGMALMTGAGAWAFVSLIMLIGLKE